MHIEFANKKLRKLANEQKEAVKALGSICARRFKARLDDLDAAQTLEHLRFIPQARCHELHGDRAGQLSLDLEHPLRLIIRPNHDPLPTLPAGGLDWKAVTSVLVVQIADTHE